MQIEVDHVAASTPTPQAPQQSESTATVQTQWLAHILYILRRRRQRRRVWFYIAEQTIIPLTGDEYIS